MQFFKNDLEKPALYILLNREKRKAYIGETDAFLNRLNQHVTRKAFWNEALAFISNDDSLSKTEVQFLESLAYSTAWKMASYDLSENGAVPKMPHMNLIQKSKTEEFFKYVQFLAKFVGCEIFEKVRHKSAKIHSAGSESKPIAPTYKYDITKEDLKGHVTIILNGKSTYKARLGVAIVREYLKEHPKTTIYGIKRIFHNGLLGEYADVNFIEDDIKAAKSIKKETGKQKYQVDSNQVLTSGDGVKFVVCSQWGNENSMNLIRFAKDQGWDIKIKSHGEVM
jgi:hypothetical protein